MWTDESKVELSDLRLYLTETYSDSMIVIILNKETNKKINRGGLVFLYMTVYFYDNLQTDKFGIRFKS